MNATRVARIGGILTALVASVAALPTPKGAGSGAATVFARLAPDSISGVAGQTRVVVLGADMGASGKSLGSYAATVSWDSTVIRLDSVAQGAQFAAPIVRYIDGGSVSLTQTGDMAGAFTLARFYFRFVNDTLGRRSVITTAFSEFNATDFTDLRGTLDAPGGVARVLPPPIDVAFTPDSVGQRVGFKPEIDLTADLTSESGLALGSYTATVSWDGALMALDSIKAGNFGAPESNQTSSGSVDLTAADANGAAGVVTVARLFFRFVGTSFPSQTAVSVSVSEMHAATSFANLLPGVTTHAGKAVIAGWLRGDIDVNDAITALDAATILNGVVGLPMSLPNGLTGLPQGDADCDGTLSARDAQIVLHHVVGNNVPFCVGRIQ